MSGVTFPYAWNPAHPARVGLLPREGDGGPDPLGRGRAVLRLPPAQCLRSAGRSRRARRRPAPADVRDATCSGPNEGAAGPRPAGRSTPTSGRAHEQRLDDRAIEFPRHDERLDRPPSPLRLRRRPSTRSATAPRSSTTSSAGPPRSTTTGRDRVTLEPVFVPRTPDAAEDDGWVLSYVYDGAHRPQRRRDPARAGLHRRRRSRPSTSPTGCRSASTATGCPIRRERHSASRHSARTLWQSWTQIDPSPTAEATRLTLPARTSPTAKTPGRLVSSR